MAEGYVPVDNAMEKKGSKTSAVTVLFPCLQKVSHDCCHVSPL